MPVVLRYGDHSITTDGQFVDEMLDNSQKNFTDLQTNCTRKFYNETYEGYQLCKEETENFEECLGFHEKKSLIGQECREIVMSGIKS